MTESPCKFIFLPGAGGGGEGDIAALAALLHHRVHFEPLGYPGWERYLASDFSADAFIAELAAQIENQVPTGPIRLMGLSIGGHLGYAAALRLQSTGREIAAFCAIDSFMIDSVKPSTGWRMRAFSEAWALLSEGRLRDFARFVRSKAWRAVLRVAEGRLTRTLQRFSGSGRLPAILTADPTAERELSMRLLLRELVPWLASLDRKAVVLSAPTILLRPQLSACHDAAWKRRCPNIAICDVPGKHHTLFEPENLAGLHDALVSAANRMWVKSGCSDRGRSVEPTGMIETML